MNAPKLVLLETFTSREEAVSALAALKEEGIFSQIDENFTSSAFPNLQVLNGVKLYVHEDKLEQAVSVLKSMQPIIENLNNSDLYEGDLPKESESVEETTAGDEDKDIQSQSKGCLSGCFGYIALMGVGFGFGILFSLGVAMSLNEVEYENARFDRNKDGREDEFHSYNRFGDFIKLTSDNNFDGENDSWWEFENGLPTQWKFDSNFDGKVDSRGAFKFGNLENLFYDLDGDGNFEKVEFFEHGILQKLEWKTQGGKVVRRELVQHGVLTEIYKLDVNGQLRLFEKLSFKGLQLPLD